MKHRIFIAINLPEDIKKRLEDYQGKWPDLPIRWTKKENLHITLVFLGYLTDDELLEICKITKEVASRHQSFSINLNKIYYGPPRKMPPRMVWVQGEKSKEFILLKDDLEKSLLEKFTQYRPALLEKSGAGAGRAFSSHITLGRIKAWEFRQIEPEERPLVDEEINLIFEVNSIEVMESKLKRGGAEYSILESCSLKS